MKAIAAREGEITRGAVASLKKASRARPGQAAQAVERRRPSSLAGQAHPLCTRLESLLEPDDRGRAVPPLPMTCQAVRRRLADSSPACRR